MKLKKSIIRLFFSAIFGGLYAMVELIFSKGNILWIFCTYIVAIEIMVLISFGKKTLKENLKIVLFTYLAAFLLNGIMNATQIKYNMWMTLFVVVIACGFLMIGMRLIWNALGEQALMYSVKITMENQTISVMALKDTGNGLIDPISKKAVSIVEREAIQQLMSENTKILYVPFKSVGKESGIMKACIVEQMEIENRKYENVIIGIFDGKLTADNKYNMILHPKLLESGGNFI